MKYGAGPLEWRELLERISTRIRILEIGNSIAKRPDVFDREEKNRLFESRTAEVKSLLVDLLKVAERKV